MLALLALLAFIHVCASMHVDIAYICIINAQWAEKKMSHLSAVMRHNHLKRTVYSYIKKKEEKKE